MKTKQIDFGKTKSGQSVFGYQLENSRGLSIVVLNYGATVVSVKTPDRNGVLEEITLGFDNITDYENHSPYFGSTIGRVGNRIRDGILRIGKDKIQLAKNDNTIHHLHGGTKGFDKKIWNLSTDSFAGNATILCSYLSIDGEENYPGNLQCSVRFTLDDGDTLTIDYRAEVDKPCPVNMTNHTYWNLTGDPGNSILNHELMLHCSCYLPVDQELIPTGAITEVSDTPWDFRQPKAISKDIDQAGGYDHCFVVDGNRGDLNSAAEVIEPVSGRKLEVFTTEPGIQFYSGNFLDPVQNKGFQKHTGFCLETQLFPDALNHKHFPDPMLQKGEIYRQTTRYRFGIC